MEPPANGNRTAGESFSSEAREGSEVCRFADCKGSPLVLLEGPAMGLTGAKGIDARVLELLAMLPGAAGVGGKRDGARIRSGIDESVSSSATFTGRGSGRPTADAAKDQSGANGVWPGSECRATLWPASGRVETSRRAVANDGSLTTDELPEGDAGERCSLGGPPVKWSSTGRPAPAQLSDEADAPLDRRRSAGPLGLAKDGDVCEVWPPPERGGSVRSVDQPTILPRPTSVVAVRWAGSLGAGLASPCGCRLAALDCCRPRSLAAERSASAASTDARRTCSCRASHARVSRSSSACLAASRASNAARSCCGWAA